MNLDLRILVTARGRSEVLMGWSCLEAEEGC